MSAALKQMTVDEFLLWAEGKDGRWELHDGVPVMMHDGAPAMSPEPLGHVRAKGEAFVALRSALKASGIRGEVFPGGAAIHIDARTVFEPDVSVVCAQRQSDNAFAIQNPVIVLEVLSPSTAAIDHGPKFSGYFSLPSVQHYLILDPERRVVIHHKRGADAIETRALSSGVAKLDPPGFELAVEALFPPA